MSDNRYRNYRVMLYPDNFSHMRALKIIQRSPDLKFYFCGIWHTLKENGSEIVSGSGNNLRTIFF